MADDGLAVSIARLRGDVEALGSIGRDEETGGVSRTSFSAADADARRWLAARVDDAGLSWREDGLGNVFIRVEPSDPAAAARPAVWSGSHIDSVPNGGRFDGALGVLAALECARCLSDHRDALRRPVQVVVFTDEEGNYHHLFGSSALARGFDADQLAGLRGRDGDRLVDTLAATGWDLDAATRTKVDPEDVHAFLELHIEQGPKLEAQHIDIGVVTSIVGLGGGELTFHGRADHAGTTPMGSRQDALSAAGAFLAGLADIAGGVSDTAVLTCGLLEVAPGASNVVPGTASLTLDFRDTERDRIERLESAVVRAAERAAAAHDVTTSYVSDGIIDPVRLDDGLRGLIESTAVERGYSTTHLPSGAGHDSQNMATLADTAMIFVPSKGGHSHSPLEDTDWPDVERGANVLLGVLATVAFAPPA